MRHGPIGALSLELWGSIFVENSDESARRHAGLPTKREARRALLHAALERHEPMERAQVNLAYDVADAAFRKALLDAHLTWSAAERLQVLLCGLNRELPAAEFAELVTAHETMLLEVPPVLVPGARETLEQLQERYRLAVVADTVFTPGRVLRRLLAEHGLLTYFEHCAFSDELGRARPHPAVYRSVASAFGIKLHELVHIGNRAHEDIGSAQAAGARAVLICPAAKYAQNGRRPDGLCSALEELPDLLATLEAPQVH